MLGGWKQQFNNFELLPNKFYHIHITNPKNEINKLILIIHAYNEDPLTYDISSVTPSKHYTFNQHKVFKRPLTIDPVDYNNTIFHNHIVILDLVDDKGSKKVNLNIYNLNESIKGTFISNGNPLFVATHKCGNCKMVFYSINEAIIHANKFRHGDISEYIGNRNLNNKMFTELGIAVNYNLFGNHIGDISYHVDNIPVISLRDRENSNDKFGW